MAEYAVDAAGDALTATRRFLLPLDLGRWARLAVVALFVGGGGGGGVLNGAADAGGSLGSGRLPAIEAVPDLPGLAPEAVGLLVVAVLALAALGLLVAVVSGVMRFVLLDALATGEVRLRGPFRNRLGDGVRLVAFEGGVWLLVGLPVAAVGAVLAGGALALGPMAIPILLGLALLGMGVAAALVLVTGLTDAFVAPVMVAEGVGVLEGWRLFWPTLAEEWMAFALYLVVRFLLGLAASVGVGVVLALVGGVVVAVLGALAVATVLAAGGIAPAVSSLPALLVLACLALVGVVSALAVLAALRVPVVTFLTHYELLVLGSADEAFALVPPARYGSGAASE